MELTIKGHVYAKEDWKEDLQFTFFDFKPVGEWVPVCEHEIKVTVPDVIDLRPGRVAALEAEKAAVTAAFQARITEINGRIQSLLALEAS